MRAKTCAFYAFKVSGTMTWFELSIPSFPTTGILGEECAQLTVVPD